jgi:gluconokinase
MTPPLSARTSALVERLFLPEDQAEAKRLLIEECGNNLPFCKDEDEIKMERLRFSGLRLSVGNLDELQRAVKVAKSDWRDLLVAARFAESVTAHDGWAESALKENSNPLVLILVGLTGSGKTTVGSLLARELGWMYYEGDTFHSTQNFTRLVHGQDIPEEDVQAWLGKLRDLISRYVSTKLNVILTCTALKESQRELLRVGDEVRFIYLHGTSQQLEENQKQRKMQLSNLERLAYQSARFEEPRDALVAEISKSPAEIAASIRDIFRV